MEYTVLSKLEAYLTLQNIEHKKNKFVNVYINNKNNGGLDIVNIKKEKGVVELYNNITDNVETYYFADLIEDEFGNLLETKKAIDAAFIELQYTSQRTEFVKYLSNTIKIIVKRENKMFSAYPVLKKVILNLVHYINEKHDCKLEYPFNIALLESDKYIPPYTLRHVYNKNGKFVKLYKQFVTNKIIVGNLITQSQFVDIFMGKETSEYVTFRIDTPNAIKILKSIKHIYFRFRPIDIERSKRFYTSKNILLTATNFSSSNDRENEENLQRTIETIKDIEELFPRK